MRDIKNDIIMCIIAGAIFAARNHLEPPRPVRLANALLHLSGSDLEPKFTELFRSRNRQRDIAVLMAADEWRIYHDLFA